MDSLTKLRNTVFEICSSGILFFYLSIYLQKNDDNNYKYVFF